MGLPLSPRAAWIWQPIVPWGLPFWCSLEGLGPQWTVIWRCTLKSSRSSGGGIVRTSSGGVAVLESSGTVTPAAARSSLVVLGSFWSRWA